MAGVWQTLSATITARAWQYLAAIAILPCAAIGTAHPGDNGVFNGGGRPQKTGVAFLNVSASDGSVFMANGAKLAPFSGLERPGLRLLYMVGTKMQEKDPLVAGRFHRFTGGRVLAGYEWHWKGLAISAYAGASVSMHTPWERAVTRHEGRLGTAALLEFWQSWRGHTLWPDGFTSGTLLADAAEGSLYLRLRQGIATGWRKPRSGRKSPSPPGAGDRWAGWWAATPGSPRGWGCMGAGSASAGSGSTPRQATRSGADSTARPMSKSLRFTPIRAWICAKWRPAGR